MFKNTNNFGSQGPGSRSPLQPQYQQQQQQQQQKATHPVFSVEQSTLGSPADQLRHDNDTVLDGTELQDLVSGLSESIRANWKNIHAEKKAAQSRNATRGAQALHGKRKLYGSEGSPMTETPEDQEDIGDELWDGDESGSVQQEKIILITGVPKVAGSGATASSSSQGVQASTEGDRSSRESPPSPTRRPTGAKKVKGKFGVPGPDEEENEFGIWSTVTCGPCARLSKPCSMNLTGRPCARCVGSGDLGKCTQVRLLNSQSSKAAKPKSKPVSHHPGPKPAKRPGHQIGPRKRKQILSARTRCKRCIAHHKLCDVTEVGIPCSRCQGNLHGEVHICEFNAQPSPRSEEEREPTPPIAAPPIATPPIATPPRARFRGLSRGKKPCGNCAGSMMICEDQRPCGSCLYNGLQDSCDSNHQGQPFSMSPLYPRIDRRMNGDEGDEGNERDIDWGEGCADSQEVYRVNDVVGMPAGHIPSQQQLQTPMLFEPIIRPPPPSFYPSAVQPGGPGLELSPYHGIDPQLTLLRPEARPTTYREMRIELPPQPDMRAWNAVSEQDAWQSLQNYAQEEMQVASLAWMGARPAAPLPKLNDEEVLNALLFNSDEDSML